MQPSWYLFRIEYILILQSIAEIDSSITAQEHHVGFYNRERTGVWLTSFLSQVKIEQFDSQFVFDPEVDLSCW